jgi:membrane associated rhomboid family serine protease
VIPLRDNVPTRAFPVVTVGLIAANAIVWFWEIGGKTSLDTDVIHYGYYPCKIDGPCIPPATQAEVSGWEGAFTSMFMHAGWTHIIFNTLRFADTQDASIPNIGASGAIAAVLGGYFLLLPRARVLSVIFVGLIFLREIPAVWFLGIWFAFQLWQGGWGIAHPETSGGVAFFAHSGGFVFGLVTVRFVTKRRPLQPSY